jgi:hypothetical protein
MGRLLPRVELNGHYFVHSANLDELRLAIPEPEARSSLVPSYPVLQYQRLPGDGLPAWVNGFNAVVVFQRLTDVDDRAAAFEMFMSTDRFDALYPDAVERVDGLTPAAVTDLDFSFLCSFEVEAEPRVEWSQVVLPAFRPRHFVVLLEALFVFQLCKRTELAINALPARRAAGEPADMLAAYTESLFNLERPGEYNVSETDAAEMRLYYKAWGIGEYIERLRERFNQATANYAFVWEQAQSERTQLVNILLGTLALLALLQADRTLAELLGVKRLLLDWIIVALALLAVTWAIWRYTIVPALRRRRQRRQAEDALRRLHLRP